MKKSRKTVSEILESQKQWPIKRELHQITVKEITDRIGISVKQYYQWESKILEQKLTETVEKISRVDEAFEQIIAEKKNGGVDG